MPFFLGRPNHESAFTILKATVPANYSTDLLLPRPQPADSWGCQVMSADLGGHLKETAANSLTQELVSEVPGARGCR